jgi:hypothetical protein
MHLSVLLFLVRVSIIIACVAHQHSSCVNMQLGRSYCIQHALCASVSHAADVMREMSQMHMYADEWAM